MDKKPKFLALIPARVGSQRVRGKNIRPLRDHPLIAYTITVARLSGLFDRIVVTTDSKLIQRVALHYGADAPFLRPSELATTVAIDINWIKHALKQLDETYDCFSILRPTSPFRKPETIRRAYDQFLSQKGIDSLRAVELCSQHPGKMWVVEGDLMRPLLDQSHLESPWHAGQYQGLPKVYVQNSSLEIAWTRVVWETNSREGNIITPFFTEGLEGFTIDYETDWLQANTFLENGEATLPTMSQKPFQFEG